jgi:hypothetical protein
LIFDFKRQSVEWDELSIPMRKLGSISKEELSPIDPLDSEAPEIIQQATMRLERAITDNNYQSHNYKTMILKCKHLNPSQQDTLIHLFKQYSSLFDGTLGKIPEIKVHLELKPNSKPYCARAYKIPQNIFKIARQEVEELCKIGVLEPNVYSEWGAPCLFRAKKNGGVRFLTDLRHLNKCLIRKPVHLPLIDDVIWKVQGFTYATCLDLNRGYYHFELDEASKQLCGIVLPWGRYVYNRLPQGCMPSSDIFQGHMSRIFYDFEDVIVYIDNIILFTKESFDHHVQRLSQVMDRIQSQNLHIHVEETFLASPEVDYLGYTLSSKGIKPQFKKILSILSLAPPSNKRQLRSFLGFVNFYRQLWYHRSHIISPLTAITSDKAKWQWGPMQQQAFQCIRNTIARQVLLKYPDFTKPFDIFTDASDYQLGAVISQEGWPIAFYSRKLNNAQRNYTTMEKELLSVIETSQHYRHLLLGGTCRFFCDHKNLGFHHFKSERVKRWRSLLEEFDYTFEYHPGKDNTIADMLSRYPMVEVTTNKLEEITTMDEANFPISPQAIQNSQNQILDLRGKLTTSRHYSTVESDGLPIYYRKGKIILGPDLFQEVLEWYHSNLNHPGQDRTYKTIASVFYTKNMEAKVRDYVDKCQICKKSKTPIKKYGLLPLSDLQVDPWEVIQLDMFGPWTFLDANGTQHAIQGLSIIDVATRWTELCPCPSKRSEDIAMLVDQQWFCRYPRPRAAIFDNGTEFSSEFMELLRSYGVLAKPTTIKNPQTNAFVERIHQVIGDAIRTMELHKRTFDDTSINAILQSVAFGLRATYHSAIAASPGQLVFGRDMLINAVYLANWKYLHSKRRSQIKANNARENKSRIAHTYNVGDSVYVRKTNTEQKLQPLQGPFPITRVHTNGTVTIRRSTILSERIHLRRLHPASTRSN